ncbi:MAG TPA: hypothetical protein VKA26_04150 [Ignavibacteriaceae bacterium]|nr:hypothetical protein [Ignavibacteriaceae bacterium]
MKIPRVFLIIVFCSLGLTNAQFDQGFSSKPIITGGISLGYTGGFGLQGNIMISNFAKDFPLAVRFALGYSSLDPGNPAAARKIFINDATNGVPEKSGTDWNYRMDLLYRVPFLSINRFYLFGGARYSAFSGEFDFINGNEFFKIKSSQWGLGFGAESYFMIVPKIDFVISSAVDYYFDSAIEGHDTSYGPDGQNINSRNGYNYSDADKAINQPKLMLRILFGFNIHF